MFFRKKKQYEMDMGMANETLQNVLAACNQAPNTIPFDKLVLRQKLNTATYTRLIWITALVLVLTFLSPLAVVPVADLVGRLSAPVPVSLASDHVEDNILYLEFDGDNILFNESYILNADGSREAPLSYDAGKGIICFTYYDDRETNIYIPVKDAQTIHLLLTPQ